MSSQLKNEYNCNIKIISNKMGKESLVEELENGLPRKTVAR